MTTKQKGWSAYQTIRKLSGCLAGVAALTASLGFEQAEITGAIIFGVPALEAIMVRERSTLVRMLFKSTVAKLHE